MGKVSCYIMWLALSAIWLLTALSVFAAFSGNDKARQFFNSIPLIIYWFFLALLFLSSFLVYDRLLRQPPSLLIHAGCLFILIGAMFGSNAGHQFAKWFFHIDKIPSGFMIIDEGQSENRVVAKDKHILGQLPFNIKLNDFRIEYYEAGYATQMPRMPRDYFSDVVVVEDGKEIIQKTIEVNHPLHYGGYHFYQYSYDEVAGRYTILSVTSDSGLYAVFGGYWLLCIGILWRFWLTPAIKYIKRKKINEALV